MLNMLGKTIGEDIELSWHPAPDLWPVIMDPAQLDQILVNLVVNARDAIGNAGKITIETCNAVFDESYCSGYADYTPGDYVMIAVGDNGCGMDKKLLEKIYEPFFTTKGYGKGTGMGLSTVYGIVKQNKGFINVYSELGKGTIFKIYIPRASREEAATGDAGFNKSCLTGDETLLLVEDNESLLKMAKTMLEELGYTVLTAGSPVEAMRVAEEYGGNIDLVVTDVVMPEMSGRDLQNKFKELRPDTRYLFMSGYTANVIAHHGVLDDGVNFLQKPFSMNEIASKVREAIEK